MTRADLTPDDLVPSEYSLVLLATHAAAGRVDGLDAEVIRVLDAGELTIDELREFVLHVAVYAGWPKAAQAEMAVREQWHRLHRMCGREAPPWSVADAADLGPDSHADRLSHGAQMFETVNLFPPPRPDSPFFQLGSISFVFGQVWTRTGLTRRQRRLITLPCVAESGATVAIEAHVTSAVRSADLTATSVSHIARVVDDAGSTEAATLLRESLRA